MAPPSLVPPSSRAGLLWVLAAAAGYALLGLCVKEAVLAFPLAQVILVRAFGGFTLSALGRWWRQEGGGFQPWGPLLVRGAAGWGALVLSFAALAHLPLTEAVLVNHTSPFFTVAIAALWLGERMTRTRWLALGLAMGGILALAWPQLQGPGAWLDPWGLGLALGGAASAGLAYVAVKQASHHHGPWSIGVAFGAVATLGSLPWAWQVGWAAPPQPGPWAWLLGVVLSSTVAQLCYAHGARALPASTGSVVLLSTPLFAGFLAWAWWGQTPQPQVAWALVALLGAGYLLWREAKEARPATTTGS